MFESPGSLPSLTAAVRPVLASCEPFMLELSAVTPGEDGYLFLLLGEGREQVRRLHESIYARALDGVRAPAQFVPHMTVGRCAGKAALQTAISEAAAIDLPLSAGRCR